MLAAHVVSTVGIGLDVVGAWLVGLEIVRKYNGNMYTGTIQSGLINEPAQKHTDGYDQFLGRQRLMMTCGLILITGGCILQILGTWGL